MSLRPKAIMLTPMVSLMASRVYGFILVRLANYLTDWIVGCIIKSIGVGRHNAFI